jgi:hypothetical protein
MQLEILRRYQFDSAHGTIQAWYAFYTFWDKVRPRTGRDHGNEWKTPDDVEKRCKDIREEIIPTYSHETFLELIWDTIEDHRGAYLQFRLYGSGLRILDACKKANDIANKYRGQPAWWEDAQGTKMLVKLAFELIWNLRTFIQHDGVTLTDLDLWLDKIDHLISLPDDDLLCARENILR